MNKMNTQCCLLTHAFEWLLANLHLLWCVDANTEAELLVKDARLIQSLIPNSSISKRMTQAITFFLASVSLSGKWGQ